MTVYGQPSRGAIVIMYQRIALTSILCVLILGQQCIQAPNTNPATLPPDLGPQPLVYMKTSMGTITIELFSYQAPQAVRNFLEYVEEGYYANSIIHQVENGSLIYGGSYTADLEAKESKPLTNEANNGLINIRGCVSLYGPAEKDSGQPQFLINLTDNPNLDFDLEDGTRPTFTVIGKVVQGMSVADEIGNLPTEDKTVNEVNFPYIPTTTVLIENISTTPLDDDDENLSPVANAGKDRNVTISTQAILDGSSSFDPNVDDELTYHWEQTDGPDVELLNANTNRATFTVPDTQTPMSFQITVTDNHGASDSSTITLTAVARTRVRLATSMGDVVIEMLNGDNEAPITSANFIQYVEDGFYNGTIFHRVMPGFVVQGGGFLPDLSKPAGLRDPIVNEYSPDRSNVRGTLAMAKLGDDPDSATSQFFFNLVDNSENLDNQNGGFTVFARVVEGMDVVDAMAEVEVGTREDPEGQSFSDVPVEDIILTSATLE